MRRALLALAVVSCGAAPKVGFAPCPVLEDRCRTDTFLALETERGQLWDPWEQPPRVVVISPSELDRRLQLVSGGPPADSMDSLHTLGLLAPGLNVAQADRRWDTNNTGAIYWPSDKEVSIIDRGGPLDDIGAIATLAHEYTHAAQDRELGSGGSWVSTDWELVQRSLFEGEAELYGEIAQLRMEATDPDTFDWRKHFGDMLSAVRGQTLTTDSPHTAVRNWFPYPVGGLLMARAWHQGGPTGASQIWLHAPASFVELLLANEGRPAPGPLAPICRFDVIPSDHFQFLSGDRLGSALFYAYLARTFGDEEAAWETSLSWRGDQIWSLSDVAKSTPVTFWRIHAPGIRDTPLGGRLVAQTAPPLLIGDDVVFWSGIDQAGATLLLQATSCGS